MQEVHPTSTRIKTAGSVYMENDQVLDKKDMKEPKSEGASFQEG